MKIRTGLAALLIPLTIAIGACGQQNAGCYDDDGEQISCNQDFDDDDDDDEDDD